jgi:hypothetical protein
MVSISDPSSVALLKPTHRCTQTSVNLENSELVQVFMVELSRELVIRDDLICGRGFDEIPVAEGERSAGLLSSSSGLTGLHSLIFRPNSE